MIGDDVAECSVVPTGRIEVQCIRRVAVKNPRAANFWSILVREPLPDAEFTQQAYRTARQCDIPAVKFWHCERRSRLPVNDCDVKPGGCQQSRETQPGRPSTNYRNVRFHHRNLLQLTGSKRAWKKRR